MNEKLINNPGPMAAIDILPEWIEARRAIVIRDGHAMRASARFLDNVLFPVIEIQSINDPASWGTLNLPNNKPHFASITDRNEVLFKLWGRDNLQREDGK